MRNKRNRFKRGREDKKTEERYDIWKGDGSGGGNEKEYVSGTDRVKDLVEHVSNPASNIRLIQHFFLYRVRQIRSFIKILLPATVPRFVWCLWFGLW